MKIRLFILAALCAGFAVTLGSAEARAAIPSPTPEDVRPWPPAMPQIPPAGETPPPADAIADTVTPGAVCGGWYRQSADGGLWPAGSTWWEYACSYSWPPPCTGICDMGYWYWFSWTDFFYWDGSSAVHYGALYVDSYMDDVFGGYGCQFWWDVPTAQWYMLDTSGCPYSGPGNAAPTAAFNSECSGLSCAFDGTSSWASDGIAAYSWDFGDGTTGSGAKSEHSYSAKGTYRVTLTVTDNGGLSSVITQTVATTDIPPTARFTFDCTGLTCRFDGSGSTDPDSTITAYYWSFGDGYSAHGSSTAENTYALAGSYTVRLEVVDDEGVSGSVEARVTVVGTSTNLPPTANFRYSCSGLTCHFDAGSSSDLDGTIVAYQWEISDVGVSQIGYSTASSTIDHTFRQAGSYSARLTVIDDGKASASSDTKMVTVTNVPPKASFTVMCAGLTCSFDGSGSSDRDGTISSYWWNFGDGWPLGVGNTTSHTYLQNGSYNVTLTVIDNGGLNSTVAKTVAIGPPNVVPTSAFTASCSELSCAFEGNGSTDGDGTIQSYGWDFGDGLSGSGATVSHPYAQSGTYNVRLTVTDDDGATDTVSRSVTVTANAPPSAAFTFSCASLTCSFDGSDSSDSDGAIVSYAWVFGDGTTGSGASVQRAYAKAGSYTVTLTVTDGDGASSSTSKTVGPVSLTARAYKVNGLQKADLVWTGSSGSFDVYRDGAKIATVQATTYTDNLNRKGSGSHVYKVCATAVSVCSNDASVAF